MPYRSSAAARQRARELAQRLGRELRIARATAGLSQQAVARRAEVSQGLISAVELGKVLPSISAAIRLAAACGMDLSLRLFPSAGVSLRDSGQLVLVQLILSRISPAWHATLEEPLRTGDRRAIDLVLRRPNEVIAIEVERRLIDLQAQLRAAQLKREALQATTAQPVRLVLAVGRSQSTSRALDDYRDLLGRTLTTSSRQAWTALMSGSDVGGDALLVLRPS